MPVAVFPVFMPPPTPAPPPAPMKHKSFFNDPLIIGVIVLVCAVVVAVIVAVAVYAPIFINQINQGNGNFQVNALLQQAR
jgi:hypothetical protein